MIMLVIKISSWNINIILGKLKLQQLPCFCEIPVLISVASFTHSIKKYYEARIIYLYTYTLSHLKKKEFATDF
jgi:hypothetical protein